MNYYSLNTQRSLQNISFKSIQNNEQLYPILVLVHHIFRVNLHLLHYTKRCAFKIPDIPWQILKHVHVNKPLKAVHGPFRGGDSSFDHFMCRVVIKIKYIVQFTRKRAITEFCDYNMDNW